MGGALWLGHAIQPLSRQSGATFESDQTMSWLARQRSLSPTTAFAQRARPHPKPHPASFRRLGQPSEVKSALRIHPTAPSPPEP